MLTVGKEHLPPAEISAGSPIRAMAFTANGEYLVSGDKEAIRMWRVADNQQVGVMKAKDVRSVAVSKDGRWIAAGKSWGETTVWDRQTFKEVFTYDSDGHTVTSVDFSPDSTRLAAASGNRKAYIWDVAARKMAFPPLEHQYWVVAAKFTPRGDRIATATFRDSVRVYDSRNGSLLVVVSAKVTPYYNTGLLWSNGSMLILSNNSINRINVTASPTSVTSEWTVDDSNYPCIASPESGELVLYSAGCEIRFYNTTSGTQSRSPIQLPQDAHSIALSPDGQFLAIGGGDGKLVIKSLVMSALSKSPRA